jgi:uncharacterized protein YjbJ (UPF0337 family)
MTQSWDQISSRWTRLSKDIKKQWTELTDADIVQVNGRREVLAEKIQEKYHLDLETANNQIDVWVTRQNRKRFL